MADRTANTVFFPSTDPLRISFRSNASDGDTITIPYGVPNRVVGINAEDDNDAIASASASGGTITFGLIDDAGAAVTVDTDLIGDILIANQ